MKKSVIALIALGIVFGLTLIISLIGFFWSKNFNNTAVVLQEDAKTKWSNVESAYQRRSDLIGNLVKTVQGAADFEKSTLTEVIEARAKATSVNIDAGKLNASQIQNFSQAQSGLTSALSKLLVSVERYPDLKSNQNFMNLQNQLEGTENRINIERNKFNETVGSYNKHIKIFPNSIFAGWFGFEEMTRYQADEGAQNAPDVEFDFNK